MKKRDLEKQSKDLGWLFLREGACHEQWTNGELTISVFRHIEINQFTAKSIIKKAKANLPKDQENED